MPGEFPRSAAARRTLHEEKNQFHNYIFNFGDDCRFVLAAVSVSQ